MRNAANEINAEYITKEGVQEFETPAWMSGHHVIYQIKPPLGSLKRIETGFDSVKGRIQVKIARQPGAFHLKLSSPPATSGTVCIPLTADGLKAARVNGSPL